MIYELHLTTKPDSSVTKWKATCDAFGVKPLVIKLSQGDYPLQIMTAAVHEGDDKSAQQWTAEMVYSFEEEGFPILRTKVEIPLDKSAPYKNPKYHEAHVKMLLSHDEALRLKGADEFEAYPSQNLLYKEFHSLEKWYLTMRAYGVPYRKAAERFGDVFSQVTAILPGVRMEMETVIVDTNPALDNGWCV